MATIYLPAILHCLQGLMMMMNNLQGRLAGLKSSSSASFSKNNQNQCMAPFDGTHLLLWISQVKWMAHIYDPF
jgi:hypothetical protein